MVVLDTEGNLVILVFVGENYCFKLNLCNYVKPVRRTPYPRGLKSCHAKVKPAVKSLPLYSDLSLITWMKKKDNFFLASLKIGFVL